MKEVFCYRLKKIQMGKLTILTRCQKDFSVNNIILRRGQVPVREL